MKKNRKDKEMERLLTNSKHVKNLGYYKGMLVTAKLLHKLTGTPEDAQVVIHYTHIVYQLESIAFQEAE